MDLHVLRPSESENHVFSVWSVYPCVCYPHNSKTNYNRSIKFDTLHLYHIEMLFEIFYKDWAKILCTKVHKTILMH